MSLYKVLSLPAFLGVEDYENFHMFNDEWIETKKEIEPIFNRYGYYLDRKKNICWAETRFGCWIIGNRADFICELDFQAADEYLLHRDVISAYKILFRHKKLPKELLMKWWMHDHAMDLRETFRTSRKKWLYIEKKEKRRTANGNSTVNNSKWLGYDV